MSNGWKVFECDLRSLALFRVGLGLALLVDLAARACDLGAHYSDAGILPRTALGEASRSFPLSLHALGGGTTFEAILFALAAVAALLLCIGYRTRWTTVVCWLLLVSLHARNPFINNEGDSLLVVLLLLGAFLPLGARYSTDWALNPSPTAGNRIFSAATAALLIQTSLVFFIAALSTRSTGAEPMDAMFPVAMLVYLGLVMPVLAFSPFLHTPLRLVLIAALMVAMISGAFRLDLETYPLAGCVALLAFIPSPAWDWLARRTDVARWGGLRIYFDQDCGFCHKICLLFRTFLVLRNTSIAPAQNDDAVFAIMQEHNSWVVYDHDGTVYVRWHAMLLVLRRSPIFRPLGRLLTALRMGEWGDGLYEVIANSRGWFSRLTAVLLPFRTVRLDVGPVANSVVGIWLAVIVAGNVFVLPYEHPERTTLVATVWHGLGLDQNWHPLGMEPSVSGRAFEVAGTLADGTVIRIDALSRRNLTGPEATEMVRMVRGERWRRYLAILAKSPKAGGAPRLIQWVCNAWQGHSEGRNLQDFTIRASGSGTTTHLEQQGVTKPNLTLVSGSCADN